MFSHHRHHPHCPPFPPGWITLRIRSTRAWRSFMCSCWPMCCAGPSWWWRTPCSETQAERVILQTASTNQPPSPPLQLTRITKNPHRGSGPANFRSRCSVRSHPIRRTVPAAGGDAEPLPLLAAGAGLRSGSLLSAGVHGAEGPAEGAR